ADSGNPKARIAIQIMDNPSRLLAATQTGITAAALLMGIYGESALTATLQQTIDQHFPALSDWASVISFAVTIALVTG
ncbi:CNNM domain-containing protein, partial [Vibrio vulnificus]|uniref:CNNM domain-containing protein n=1 Tax=Vibrio vulnificus TaxID=672 RepID=UPI0039B5901B